MKSKSKFGVTEMYGTLGENGSKWLFRAPFVLFFSNFFKPVFI
jgi:hypothetical protein